MALVKILSNSGNPDLDGFINTITRIETSLENQVKILSLHDIKNNT